MASGSSQMMDKFFNLGSKATRGDPVRKAYFDYCLYWVVFLTFVFLSINYIYSYFIGNGSIGSLGWGIVVGIFSWFNYWALISFRMAYLNMKKFYDKPKDIEKFKEDEDEFEGLFNPNENED
jgi:hypothetical protein